MECEKGSDEYVYVSILPDTMKPSTALFLLQRRWADALNYRLHELSQPHYTHTHTRTHISAGDGGKRKERKRGKYCESE